MENITEFAGRLPRQPLILHDLEAGKGNLEAAIRHYQSVRLSAARGGGGDVQTAEDKLVEAWRVVIDLEGRMAGFKPLPRHHS